MTKHDGSQTCDGCTREQQQPSGTRSGSHIGTRTGTTGQPIPPDAYKDSR